MKVFRSVLFQYHWIEQVILSRFRSFQTLNPIRCWDFQCFKKSRGDNSRLFLMFTNFMCLYLRDLSPYFFQTVRVGLQGVYRCIHSKKKYYWFYFTPGTGHRKRSVFPTFREFLVTKPSSIIHQSCQKHDMCYILYFLGNFKCFQLNCKLAHI